MKTALLTIAISLGLVTANANHINSELHLKMNENGPFSMTLDNQSFYVTGNSITFGNLVPGSHMLVITKPAPYSYGHCGMPLVIFNGCVEIPANSKIKATIDWYHNYKVLSVCPLYIEPVYSGYGGGCSYGCNEPCNHGGGYGYNTNYNYGPVCMSPQAFSQLLYSIESKPFDSSRLQIAKQALSMNYVSAAQVSQLMDLMTFESTKLVLAKYAYKRTIDKQNYYTVNNAFTFESSINDLEYYISHC